MHNRRFPRRPRLAGNAIDEGHEQAGLGELPEDLMRERRIRPPILTPRGFANDNPFTQMPPVSLPPVNRTYNPAAHITYSVSLPAGAAVQVFATSRERPYSLIVNSGANACVITYGRPPADATDGIPLAAAGVGFHELINGTTSTVWAFAAAATTLQVTEGRYDPAMEM